MTNLEQLWNKHQEELSNIVRGFDSFEVFRIKRKEFDLAFIRDLLRKDRQEIIKTIEGKRLVAYCDEVIRAGSEEERIIIDVVNNTINKIIKICQR